MRDLLHHFTYAADSLARTAHLDKVKATAVQEAYEIISKVSMLYGFLQLYSSNALVSYTLLRNLFPFDANIQHRFSFCGIFCLQESLAYILAGRDKSNGTPNRANSKKSPKHRNANSRANNNPIVVNNANGTY